MRAGGEIDSSSDRVTYVGHASALVELGGARLLTDPVLRTRLMHIVRHPPAPDASVTEAIDAVLLSHLHPDHLDFPSLRSIGESTRVIAPRGARRTLARHGFREVTELAPGQSTTVGPLQVAAVPADHDGRRYKVGRRVDSLGFVISGKRAPGGHRVYFAGDTDLFDEMVEIGGGPGCPSGPGSVSGPSGPSGPSGVGGPGGSSGRGAPSRLDVALLPVAGWGRKVGKGHLDPGRAAKAAAILRPRVAIPIHWGTLFRIGLARRRPDLVDRPPHRFAAELAELAPGVKPRLLAPGETYRLAELDGRSP
jgi:L-ascorbate metabolism protein UlaG (beta-lactamase superfamily)